MEFKITAPRRIKAIDAGVIKNIGTVPALTAELEVVDVRSGPALEDRDELVFRAVKASLAGITLVPNQKVFPFRISNSFFNIFRGQSPGFGTPLG